MDEGWHCSLLETLEVLVVHPAENGLEEKEDEEKNADDGMVGVKQHHLVCERNTKTESNNIEKIRSNLEDGMERDQSGEAHQSNGDGTKWEEHGECETSHDTVSHQHRLLLLSRESMVRGAVVGAASGHIAAWAGIIRTSDLVGKT